MRMAKASKYCHWYLDPCKVSPADSACAGKRRRRFCVQYYCTVYVMVARHQWASFCLRAYGRPLSRSGGPTFRVQRTKDSQTVSWDDGKHQWIRFGILVAELWKAASMFVQPLDFPRMTPIFIRTQWDCTVPGTLFPYPLHPVLWFPGDKPRSMGDQDILE